MPDTASTGRASGGAAPPLRPFRMTPARRAGDALIRPLIRAGLVPGCYLLTTRGRKTGRLRTTPVTIVERDGQRWLVAPYGPVSWVHNARAAGRVTLTRRRTSTEYRIREVGADEAGPVLKRYLAVTGPPRAYFRASKDAPVAEFVAEADRHPVFELIPTE
jgi:deazaflavin-dependent oxidoreductase (nitroreductase family)